MKQALVRLASIYGMVGLTLLFLLASSCVRVHYHPYQPEEHPVNLGIRG